MAGISRRGEGGGDVDGRAFMVARRSPLPGLDNAAESHPLAYVRRPVLTIFSFSLLLGLISIRACKSALIQLAGFICQQAPSHLPLQEPVQRLEQR